MGKLWHTFRAIPYRFAQKQSLFEIACRVRADVAPVKRLIMALPGMCVWLKQPRAIAPVKAELDALGIVEFVSLDEHRAAVAIMDAHQAQVFKG